MTYIATCTNDLPAMTRAQRRSCTSRLWASNVMAHMIFCLVMVNMVNRMPTSIGFPKPRGWASAGYSWMVIVIDPKITWMNRATPIFRNEPPIKRWQKWTETNWQLLVASHLEEWIHQAQKNALQIWSVQKLFQDHRLLQDPSHVLHCSSSFFPPKSLKRPASLACPGWSWSSRSTSRAAGDSLATHRAPHPPCHPAEEPEEVSGGWSHHEVG